MTVRFEVTGAHGGNWDVRMDESGLVVDLDGTAPAPEYTFTVAGRWLRLVLTGDVGWEDLLLSLRLSARRDPDQYNDYLIGLLKHANAPALRAVEEYETGRNTEEWIVVQDGASAFEVSRYCPHAGEDLTISAVVEDGVLRCLAHNFAFDLTSGACLNARCDALPTRPVQPATASVS
jgi:UDP-MurNAc hydroxylase